MYIYIYIYINKYPHVTCAIGVVEIMYQSRSFAVYPSIYLEWTGSSFSFFCLSSSSFFNFSLSAFSLAFYVQNMYVCTYLSTVGMHNICTECTYIRMYICMYHCTCVRMYVCTIALGTLYPVPSTMYQTYPT